MFDKFVVQKALNHSLEHDPKWKWPSGPDLNEASLVSLLIHDVFGGEILKTHEKAGWHFYNRIEGKRLDFTSKDIGKMTDDVQFEDIPTTPDEINNYFEKEDYSVFFMRFIRAFEEAVGLDKYKPLPC